MCLHAQLKSRRHTDKHKYTLTGDGLSEVLFDWLKYVPIVQCILCCHYRCIVSEVYYLFCCKMRLEWKPITASIQRKLISSSAFVSMRCVASMRCEDFNWKVPVELGWRAESDGGASANGYILHVNMFQQYALLTHSLISQSCCNCYINIILGTTRYCNVNDYGS